MLERVMMRASARRVEVSRRIRRGAKRRREVNMLVMGASEGEIKMLFLGAEEPRVRLW